jgi:hypothetical protein
MVEICAPDVRGSNLNWVTGCLVSLYVVCLCGSMR